jgi:hypothetical protein
MKPIFITCQPEIWERCIGFENSYEISTLGNVRSVDRFVEGRRGLIKGKNINKRKNKRGYYEIRVGINGKYEDRIVHRLVAKTFIPNLENKPQVNHINGNKLDNRIENLEWNTNSENQKHAYKIGTQPNKKGSNNSNTSLTDDIVINIINIFNLGKKPSIISKELNISLGIIRNIVQGRTWKHLNIPINRKIYKKPKYE